MPAFLIPVLQWIFSKVVVTFILLTVIGYLMTELAPIAVEYAQPYIQTAAIEAGFSQLYDGSQYFADVVQLGFGLSLLFSAYIVRFLIRRIPFVG